MKPASLKKTSQSKKSPILSLRAKRGNLILFFLALFFIAADLLAAPRLTLPEATYNFGTVAQGEKIKRSFILKNTGDETLEIQRVVPACGCTVSDLEKSKLAPGDETALNVELDTRGFSGAKVKTIRVYTNDPKQVTQLLTLRGEIQPEVLVDPPRIHFGEVVKQDESKKSDAEWITQRVAIKVRGDSKAKLGDVVSRSKWLKLAVEKDSDKEKVLMVSLNPALKLGEFRDRIVLSVNNSPQRTVNLPVYASVRGKIQVKPQGVSFGIVKGTEVRSRTVRILSRSTESLQVRGIEVDHPALKASLDESSSDKELRITVSMDPTKVNKDLKSVVRVQLDRNGEGEAEEILVSVTAVLPPKFLEKKKS